MRRRDFIAFGCGVAVWPLGVWAQPQGKIHRVALILTTSPLSETIGSVPSHPGVRAFLTGLRDPGYVEGQNLTVERRSAEGKFERFGEIARELVEAKADVLVTVGNALAREVKRVTNTTPIVMVTSDDPVGAGLVTSLNRPGGNITGFTVHGGTEFEGKRVELVNEMVPQLSRIAFLGVKDEWEGPVGTVLREAARKLGLTLLPAIHTPKDYTAAFALIASSGPLAMLVTRHVSNYANRQLILTFATDHRVPAMYAFRECVDAGGLVSYGVSVSDLLRRAAGYVDKILRGEKPADLPVEQPTKFELVINLKTAKALGITVPPTVLARADEVIE
jgi:putative tryptophan/tyrosine transport system substrate-binding protein